MKEHYNFKIGDVVICKRLACDMSKPIGGVVTAREYKGYGTYKCPTYQINGSNMWVQQPLLKGVYARTTVLDGGDFAKIAEAYGYINMNEGVDMKHES